MAPPLMCRAQGAPITRWPGAAQGRPIASISWPPISWHPSHGSLLPGHQVSSQELTATFFLDSSCALTGAPGAACGLHAAKPPWAWRSHRVHSSRPGEPQACAAPVTRRQACSVRSAHCTGDQVTADGQGRPQTLGVRPRLKGASGPGERRRSSGSGRQSGRPQGGATHACGAEDHLRQPADLRRLTSGARGEELQGG